jgi:putative PIN family toxin of toxin-antitoxin system
VIVVLDTNVLASGFIGEDKPDSTPGELVRRWRAQAFTLVVSEHILTELADTLTDPYFTRRLSASEIADALDSLRLDGVMQPITVDVTSVASHAEDDVVLATALSARAKYLVTGDKRLRERVAYRGTLLVSPRRFLAVLESEAPA